MEINLERERKKINQREKNGREKKKKKEKITFYQNKKIRGQCLYIIQNVFAGFIVKRVFI